MLRDTSAGVHSTSRLRGSSTVDRRSGLKSKAAVAIKKNLLEADEKGEERKKKR